MQVNFTKIYIMITVNDIASKAIDGHKIVYKLN